MERPLMQVTSITIGAPDPRALAAFYARMLGWDVVNEEQPGDGEPAAAGWAQLRPPAGDAGPTLNMEYEAHFQRPVWPSEPGRQHITQHLDIWVTDLDEAVSEAVAAGAEIAEHQPQDDVRVMIDPAGHPFCLFR